jgi:hypothetical protein
MEEGGNWLNIEEILLKCLMVEFGTTEKCIEWWNSNHGFNTIEGIVQYIQDNMTHDGYWLNDKTSVKLKVYNTSK